MIPDSNADFGSKKSKSTPELSAQDLEAITEAFKVLKDLGVNSFSSVEAYVEWYRNVFGELALEILLEDCKKALREKDYKKMLAVVAAMAANHKKITVVQEAAKISQNPEVVVESTFEQAVETVRPDIAEEFTDIEKPTVAEEFADLSEQEIESLLKEYEQYFDEHEIEEIAIDEKQKLFDESGHVSFGEISKLVTSVETHLAALVVSGELSEQEASELITELKEIEVGKFATLSEDELEVVLSELPTFDIEQVREFVENVQARENIEQSMSTKMFGEEGFIDLSADAFKRLNSDATMTFAEMEAKNKAFEAELIALVENGTISSDQAYALKDKVDNAPVEQALVVSETAIAVVTKDGIETPEQVQAAISDFVNNDYETLVVQAPTALEQSARTMALDEAGFLEVSNPFHADNFDVRTPITPTDSLGIEESFGTDFTNLAEAPTFESSNDFDFSAQEVVAQEIVMEGGGGSSATASVSSSTSSAAVASSVAATSSSIASSSATTITSVANASAAVSTAASVATQTTSAVSAVAPTTGVVAPPVVQQPIAENFVPVTVFAPGTRPSEVPTAVPTQVTDVAPNVVTQPQNYVKSDVGVQTQIDPQTQPAQPQVQPQQRDQQQADTRQDQQPQQRTQQQEQPAEAKETPKGPEINEPEDTDFNKGPCQDCNQDCSQCGVLNAEHLKGKLEAERDTQSPVSPAVSPSAVTPGPITPGPITPGPITPGPITPGPIGIESRGLAQPSMSR